MAQGTNSQTRIRAIDERLTRLRAERIRLAARLSHAERKRDTRRKILVGAVLAAVEHELVPSSQRCRAAQLAQPTIDTAARPGGL
jgi:hypothetical protein